MRFFIKAAFWLTVVVLLLPSEPAKQGQTAQVSPLEALGAAQAAVEDASGFCERNPDACTIGSQAFQSFGEKAQYGAKLLYEFLSARFTGETAPVATAPPASKRSSPTARRAWAGFSAGWRSPGSAASARAPNNPNATASPNCTPARK